MVMIGFCRGRPMMAMPQTRGHSYCRRQRDDGADAEEDDRVCERRYRLSWSRRLRRPSLPPSVPHPAGAHHDIDLKQQSTEIGGLHQFGFTGVRTERRSHSAGYGPERDRPDIQRDPSGEHWCRGPSQHCSCPDQLEQSD